MPSSPLHGFVAHFRPSLRRMHARTPLITAKDIKVPFIYSRIAGANGFSSNFASFSYKMGRRQSNNGGGYVNLAGKSSREDRKFQKRLNKALGNTSHEQESLEDGNATPLWHLLAFINESSKWVASFASLLAVLLLHNRSAAWFAIGAVGNAALGKLLKKLLNQQRPSSAAGIKEDPGMPSSHAVSLSFLTTYAALAVLQWRGPSPLASASAVALVALGVALSLLRIAVGYHTSAQVGVGFAMGFSFANLWHSLWLLLQQQQLPPALSLALDVFLVAGGGAVAAVSLLLVLPAWLKQAKILK